MEAFIREMHKSEYAAEERATACVAVSFRTNQRTFCYFVGLARGVRKREREVRGDSRAQEFNLANELVLIPSTQVAWASTWIRDSDSGGLNPWRRRPLSMFVAVDGAPTDRPIPGA